MVRRGFGDVRLGARRGGRRVRLEQPQDVHQVRERDGVVGSKVRGDGGEFRRRRVALAAKASKKTRDGVRVRAPPRPREELERAPRVKRVPLDVRRDAPRGRRDGRRRSARGFRAPSSRGFGGFGPRRRPRRVHPNRRVPRGFRRARAGGRFLRRARALRVPRGGGRRRYRRVRGKRVRGRRPRRALARLRGIDSPGRGRGAPRAPSRELRLEPFDLRLVFLGPSRRIGLRFLPFGGGGVPLAERRLGSAQRSDGDCSVGSPADQGEGVPQLGVVRGDPLEFLHRSLHPGRVPLRAGHPARALGLAGALEDGLRAVPVVRLERRI
mmetsp:Transcript_12128/g.52290  ORF Transcript_12128/g.52290 Transcript_12128/m.52290 type:complete len:325 (-) Transcript_12128:105-1079(-)